MENEYKSVCDECYRKTWYETEQQCHCSYPKVDTCETCGHSETVEPYQEVRCTGTLRVIDNSDLDSRLTSFYKNKERIEITHKDGSKTRCYVGKSTGWKPVYLEISRRNSTGGGSLYLSKDDEIRGLGIYE